MSLADKFEDEKLLQKDINRNLAFLNLESGRLKKNYDAIQAEYEGCSNSEQKRQGSGKAKKQKVDR